MGIMFTADTLIYYLMEQQLLPVDDVVNGEVSIIPIQSRNQSFKVVDRNPYGYFVKQASLATKHTMTLQREAAWYRVCAVATEPPFTHLHPYLPDYFGYDLDQALLIIALVPNGMSLQTYHRLTHQYPVQIGEWLGQALAACHSIQPNALPPQEHRLFQPQLPWMLTAGLRRPVSNSAESPAKAEILDIIHNDSDLLSLLSTLRTQWRAETMIHGDLKWENCLLPRSKPDDPLTSIIIVDWESCSPGDPAWDVGCILHGYLADWIFSMPISAPHTLDAMVAQAAIPLEQILPTLQTFWQTYCHVMFPPGDVPSDWQNRCLRFAGARLLQSAYERLQNASFVTPHSIYLLQVGSNLLRDPSIAAQDWLQLG